jgi:hypothetical protein
MAPGWRSLTFLGCDGSYPGPGGAASGSLVEASGVVIWLDAGSGTFENLQLVLEPERVDAIVISHEHPDHWSDIDSFAVWRRQRGQGPPVPVYAPPGLQARSYLGDDAVLAWHEIEPSQRVVLSARDGVGTTLVCSFASTDHGAPTLALRVDLQGQPPGSRPPSSIAYTADTGPGWSPEELGPGIGLLPDVLAAEATRRLAARCARLFPAGSSSGDGSPAFGPSLHAHGPHRRGHRYGPYARDLYALGPRRRAHRRGPHRQG